MMPKVNTKWMNIFLENISKHLNNQTAIIVMDRASWHRSKYLKVPQNIKVILLPPYSPELNPVERLWRHIKHQTIRNKIYESLYELEMEVSIFLSKITNNDILSICKLNYL